MKIQYCRVMALLVVLCISFFLVGKDKGFEDDRGGVPKMLSVFTDKMREVFGGRPMNGMYQRGFHVVLESFDSAWYLYPQPFELYISEVTAPIEFGNKKALHRYMKETTRPALEVSFGSQVYRINVAPSYITLFQPCYRVDLSRFCSDEISVHSVLYALVALVLALPEIGGAIFLPAEWFHFSYEAGAGRQLLADRFYDLACAIFAPSCKIKKYFTDSILLKQEEAFLAKVEDSPGEWALIEQYLERSRPAASTIALRYFKHALSKWGNMSKALELLLSHIVAGNRECSVCLLDLIFQTSCSLQSMFSYPKTCREGEDSFSGSIDCVSGTGSTTLEHCGDSLLSIRDRSSTASDASSETAGSESSEEDDRDLAFYEMRLDWFTVWWKWYVDLLVQKKLQATIKRLEVYEIFSAYATQLSTTESVCAEYFKDWINKNIFEYLCDINASVTRRISLGLEQSAVAMCPVREKIGGLYLWAQDTPTVYGLSAVFVDPLK